jgi:hypothetical protein
VTATSNSAIAMISLQINSSEHLLQIEPRFTLLDVLREYIHLSGPDQGQCGACTVHVDGRRVLACLTFACQVEGHSYPHIVAAADIENAVFHAKGKRHRDLPITIEKLMPIFDTLLRATWQRDRNCRLGPDGQCNRPPADRGRSSGQGA